MSDNNEKLIDLKKLNLTHSVAIDFVNQCRNISDDQLVNQLLLYINVLEEAIKKLKWDELEPIVHVINKGFKHVSEEAGALKFYYFGYYSHIQEDLIKKFSEQIFQDKIQQLAQTKHIKEILEYLYECGCSRQSEISKNLKIDKSNLSRKMEYMIESDLVDKRSGPKCVYYELSASGYEYCRKSGIGESSFGSSEYRRKTYVATLKSDPKILYSENLTTNTIASRNGFIDIINRKSGAIQELIGIRTKTRVPQKA